MCFEAFQFVEVNVYQASVTVDQAKQQETKSICSEHLYFDVCKINLHLLCFAGCLSSYSR